MTDDVLVYNALCEHASTTQAELAGTGWKPRGPRASPALAATPEIVTLKSSRKGSVYLHARALRGRWTYEAQFAEGDAVPTEAAYQAMLGTAAKRTVGGFTSGKRVWVRLRAVRGSQQSAWSDAASVVVR